MGTNDFSQILDSSFKQELFIYFLHIYILACLNLGFNPRLRRYLFFEFIINY